MQPVIISSGIVSLDMITSEPKQSFDSGSSHKVHQSFCEIWLKSYQDSGRFHFRNFQPISEKSVNILDPLGVRKSVPNPRNFKIFIFLTHLWGIETPYLISFHSQILSAFEQKSSLSTIPPVSAHLYLAR